MEGHERKLLSKSLAFLVSALLVVVLAGWWSNPELVLAATVTWTGGTTGNWETGSNWSSGVVPTSVDEVTISSSTASITVTISAGQSANFNTLTVTSSDNFVLAGNIQSGGSVTIGAGSSITQSNAVQQAITGALTISSGGTLKHAQNTFTQTYIINFSAADIDIQSGATVNVDGLGYLYSSTANSAGLGPGAGGAGFGGNGAGGAGHGGAGGHGGYVSGTGGSAYCSSTSPSTIGSSGGNGVFSGVDETGGGGLVVLYASNNVNVNGTITAKGSDIHHSYQGGSAGGGVKLTGNTVTGNPASITVAGGSGLTSEGGGGGGGCVRINYITSNSITTSTISGGSKGTGGGQTDGSTGTFSTYQIPINNLPTTPTTSNVATSSIRFSWISGGGNETYFTVDKSTNGNTFTSVATTTTSTVQYDFTGLSANTRYWFRVASSNGGLSATSTYVTSSPVYTYASVPTSTTATTNSESQITLSWNGDGTTYYAENITAGTNSGWISSTSYAFTSLTCNTAYSFQVTARNGDGVATSSTSPVSGTTSACPTSGGGGGGGGTGVGFGSPPPIIPVPIPTSTNEASSGGLIFPPDFYFFPWQRPGNTLERPEANEEDAALSHIALLKSPSIVTIKKIQYLRYTYRYQNSELTTQRYTIKRKLLDVSGKTILNTGGIRTLRPQQAFSFSVNERIRSKLLPGRYTVSMLVLDSKGQEVDSLSSPIDMP